MFCFVMLCHVLFCFVMLCTYVRTYVRTYVCMYVCKLPMVYMGVSEKVSTTQLAISIERIMINQWVIYGGIQNKNRQTQMPNTLIPKMLIFSPSFPHLFLIFSPSFPHLFPIFSPSLRDQSPILEFHILLLRSIATQPGWEQHHDQVDAIETEEAQRLGQALGMPKGMPKPGSMDWFCWENLNRKPMGFYHQI